MMTRNYLCYLTMAALVSLLPLTLFLVLNVPLPLLLLTVLPPCRIPPSLARY